MPLPFYKNMFVAGAILFAPIVHAQDEGFIYGKVKTEDGRVYEGAIRWGKEEVYWNDIFNASKLKNENLKYLSEEDREELDQKRHGEWFSWTDNFRIINTRFWDGDDDNRYVHQFSCQFGEIKSVRPTGREYVELEMKNGQVFEVSGEGYNDVGLEIKVMDKELGEVDVHWSKIDKIEFMSTPPTLVTKFGKPLYGTVEAFGEKFTGYIQWDHDERLTGDKLDGDSEDGDLSIEFGKIKSIERRGGRSYVVLKSGRELTLHGSNDVSSGHRGVIIMGNEFASIDVPWDEFDKVLFEEKIPYPVATYSQFATQKELRGKVSTHSGKSFEGKIVYDLDEAYEYELLQGKEGEFEYATAFRNVKRLTTKGSHRCTVELRSGKKITLDEGQDVNEKHQGVLVFASKEAPTYVPWDDINEIEFNKK